MLKASYLYQKKLNFILHLQSNKQKYFRGSALSARGDEVLFRSLKYECESSSGVEHHLAKVRVAGSNPVFRS